MHSNDVLQMTDTRYLSPQTSNSSGYHSDLSSPQSIHENPIDQSKTNLPRLSKFFRKQYERVKTKFRTSKPPVQTASKATSTTTILHDQSSIRQSIQRNSFIEPVHSIYVRPLHNKLHRHLVTLSNYDNTPSQFYSKPCFSQDYYPYKYLNKNYGYNRTATTYAPLSDFVTTTNSAFKPIQPSLKHSRSHLSSDDTSYSNDPCDLEVAQYFRQASRQRTNPTYYDIYQTSLKKPYTETLC